MASDETTMEICPQSIARSGYLQVAEALRLQGADPESIRCGAENGGHIIYANKLKELIELQRNQTMDNLCERLVKGTINHNK